MVFINIFLFFFCFPALCIKTIFIPSLIISFGRCVGEGGAIQNTLHIFMTVTVRPRCPRKLLLVFVHAPLRISHFTIFHFQPARHPPPLYVTLLAHAKENQTIFRGVYEREKMFTGRSFKTLQLVFCFSQFFLFFFFFLQNKVTVLCSRKKGN